MKKIIRASSAYNTKYIAERIIIKAKELRDMMDYCPEEVINEFSLNPLYEELNDTIFEVSHQLDPFDGEDEEDN